jgi:FkbM family methyltransferase
MSALLARIFRIAVFLIAALVILPLLVIALTPHWRRTMKLSVRSAVLMHRAARFPRFARDRHPSCSVSAAWDLAVTAEGAMERQEIAARNRVLRTESGFALVDTQNGPFWIPERDLPTLAEMIQEQQHDIYGAGGRGVRAGDVVLDCGANVGVYTRHALSAGAKLVIAIDPAPSAVACLRRNFEAEIRTGRVIIYPKGVWSRDADLELTTNPAYASAANSVAINRGDRGPTVPLTTIDAIVRELELDRVDFIKMDIEGAEAQALEGGRATIARYRPRMAIALEHRPSDPDTISRAVRGLSAQTQEFGPCVNLGGHLQPNVLFVR